MAIHIHSKAEIDKMRATGRLAAQVLEFIEPFVKPGVTTDELDRRCHDFIVEHDAIPAPLNYKGFPRSICTSINEVVCHGIPGSRTLAEGDIINIDVSAELDGYVADMGESFVLPGGSPERAHICQSVRQAVRAALTQVRAGRSLNVIGSAVQKVAERTGYRIVENLGSHGVGRSLHEEPSYIPRHNPNERRTLKKGMVLTIEPFFSDRADWVEEEADGWTLSVPHGVLVAQYEHTLIVTDGAPIVVTG